MEAIFLVCGAGGPQLKRNPLGSTAQHPEQSELIIHMRLVVPSAFATVVACSSSVHSARSSSPAPEEIRSVIAIYDAAWNRRDTATVTAMLADDYVYFSSEGRVLTRAETLLFLASPTYLLEAGERSELKVTHAGPTTVVVSSRWRGHGAWNGERF